MKKLAQERCSTFGEKYLGAAIPYLKVVIHAETARGLVGITDILRQPLEDKASELVLIPDGRLNLHDI